MESGYGQGTTTGKVIGDMDILTLTMWNIRGIPYKVVCLKYKKINIEVVTEAKKQWLIVILRTISTTILFATHPEQWMQAPEVNVPVTAILFEFQYKNVCA